MTPSKAKQLLPIITAFAEGKTIQLKQLDGSWSDETTGLNFSAAVSDYRIKPEPRVKWLIEFKDIDGDRVFTNVAADTKDAAERNGRAQWTTFIRAVKFVEVVE
jgi:hypothetical protein